MCEARCTRRHLDVIGLKSATSELFMTDLNPTLLDGNINMIRIQWWPSLTWLMLHAYVCVEKHSGWPLQPTVSSHVGHSGKPLSHQLLLLSDSNESHGQVSVLESLYTNTLMNAIGHLMCKLRLTYRQLDIASLTCHHYDDVTSGTTRPTKARTDVNLTNGCAINFTCFSTPSVVG